MKISPYDKLQYYVKNWKTKNIKYDVHAMMIYFNFNVFSK